MNKDINNPKLTTLLDSPETLHIFFDTISSLITEFNNQTSVLTAEMKSVEGNQELLMKLATQYAPVLGKYYSLLVKKYAPILGKFPAIYKTKINDAVTYAKKNNIDVSVFATVHNKMELAYASANNSPNKNPEVKVAATNNPNIIH